MRIHNLIGTMPSALASIEENSFDGVFCDPPYELGFMGKSWDSSGVAFQPETWAEVLRVCKPGAHLLAFGGSRTFHRLVCAVEDAGWEVRDVLMWVYGSGFPKSLDVSKAIDKLDAAEEQERRRLRFTGWVRSQGVNACQIDKATGTNMGGHYTTAASQPAIMTREHLEQCRHLFRGIPAWVEQEADKRSVESENFKRREVIGEYRGTPGGLGGERFTFLEQAITAPATESARLWDGYGTALKPAYEPVVLARKPLGGTVAQNVQKWGCGALWIDGGRVGETGARNNGRQAGTNGIYGHIGATERIDYGKGRWPANVLHDGLPEEWARYFYCAKASTKERNAGCEALPERTSGDVTGGRKDGSAGLNSPRAGAGRTSGARNIHPTVKPIDLCRYLATLILPPADRPHGPRKLLVPFSGSGSEMIGALVAGWEDVVGVEASNEYATIARARAMCAMNANAHSTLSLWGDA